MEDQAEAILICDPRNSRRSNPPWRSGEQIAGGLGSSFWKNEWETAFQLPESFSLYGELPPDITPKALVETGRGLRSRMRSDRTMIAAVESQ